MTIEDMIREIKSRIDPSVSVKYFGIAFGHRIVIQEPGQPWSFEASPPSAALRDDEIAMSFCDFMVGYKKRVTPKRKGA